MRSRRDDGRGPGTFQSGGQPSCGSITTLFDLECRAAAWVEAWLAPYVRDVLGPIDTQFEYRRDLPRIPADLVPVFGAIVAAHAALRDADLDVAEREVWPSIALDPRQLLALCLRARLGVLRSRVEALRAQAEARLEAARSRLREVQRAEAYEVGVQQVALRRQAGEAHGELAKLRATLCVRGKWLVEECLRDVDQALARGAGSTEQLTACLTRAVEGYVAGVVRDAALATSALLLTVPPFSAPAGASLQIAGPADDLGSGLAALDTIVRVAAQALGGIVGVDLGSWLGGLLGAERDASTRERARTVAEQATAALRAAAVQYIATVDAAVGTYERLSQPSEIPSEVVRAARARLRTEETLAAWAGGLARAIGEAEGIPRS